MKTLEENGPIAEDITGNPLKGEIPMNCVDIVTAGIGALPSSIVEAFSCITLLSTEKIESDFNSISGDLTFI